MSFTLPNELVEQFERGNVLLFLGDALAQIDGQSVYARIGAALGERMQLRPGACIPARKDSLILEAQNLPAHW